MLYTKIKYKKNPNSIFTVAPAITTAILFGIEALLNAPSTLDSSSSPSRLTNPPKRN